MIEVGRFHDVDVVKVVRFGAYVGPADDAVLVPGKFLPEGTRVGDRLRVFVYHDSEDRPVATTRAPLAALDEFAAMRVVDVTPHGAFVDWGLEKDLFVPNVEQFRQMVVDSIHVVAVRMDERTGRLIGSSKLAGLLDDDPSELEPGREVDLLVYGANAVGALAVVDQRYAGLVYHDEGGRSLRVGTATVGYVDRLRRDGKVDVSLRKRGRAAQLDAGEVILAALRDSEAGFLPLHDKSPADRIARQLDMSKKVFKAAIGGLLKSGEIDLEEDGIRLRDG
ncbi:MAG: S1-like domain-containing RNA-binding protein [Planctomycetota bacterium]